MSLPSNSVGIGPERVLRWRELYVWQDKDGDKVQDQNEFGIPGVRVSPQYGFQLLARRCLGQKAGSGSA